MVVVRLINWFLRDFCQKKRNFLLVTHTLPLRFYLYLKACVYVFACVSICFCFYDNHVVVVFIKFHKKCLLFLQCQPFFFLTIICYKLWILFMAFVNNFSVFFLKFSFNNFFFGTNFVLGLDSFSNPRDLHLAYINELMIGNAFRMYFFCWKLMEALESKKTKFSFSAVN